MTSRTFALIVLAVVGLGVAWHSARGARSALKATSLCEAVASGNPAAIDGFEFGALESEDLPQALECFCVGASRRNDMDACAAAARSTDTLPASQRVTWELSLWFERHDDLDRAIASAWAATRTDLAELSQDEAAQLAIARRAVRIGLSGLPETVVIDRCTGSQPSVAIAVACAETMIDLGQPERALTIVDDNATVPFLTSRFAVLARALAELKRPKTLEELASRWRSAGVKEAEVDARIGYALYASTQDPRAHFNRAWQARAELTPDLQMLVGRRILQSALVMGDDALARRIVEEAREVGLTGLSLPASQSAPVGVPGPVTFVARAPGTLTLVDGSAATSLPPRRERLVATQEVVVSPSIAPHPLRYVFVSDDGRSVIGNAPLRPEGARVALETSSVLRPTVVPAAALRPGDGVPHVVVLIADSADWRLVRVAEAAGLMPHLHHLLEDSVRGVLISDPPSTGAAMRKLRTPGRKSDNTAGVLAAFGTQLQAGLQLPENPFAILQLLSRDDSVALVEKLAHFRWSAVDMTFGHGESKGRNITVVGPGRDRTRTVTTGPLRGVKTEDGIDVLAHPPLVARELDRAAAQFDVVEHLVDATDPLVLLYRYDPTDVVAHNFYGSLEREGTIQQPDPLLDAYAYLDVRLGRLMARLDDDDVLILISDHGTQNASVHSREALFVVHHAQTRGEDVGALPFEGVPDLIASLACVPGHEIVFPWAEPSHAACATSGQP